MSMHWGVLCMIAMLQNLEVVFGAQKIVENSDLFRFQDEALCCHVSVHFHAPL
jgi:hypothetical protein